MIGPRWLSFLLPPLRTRCRVCRGPLTFFSCEGGVVAAWCDACAPECSRGFRGPAEQIATMTTGDICTALRSRADGIFVVMIGEANAAKTGDDARVVIHVGPGRGERQRLKGAIEGGFQEFLRRFQK